jgi:hypothetical protein
VRGSPPEKCAKTGIWSALREPVFVQSTLGPVENQDSQEARKVIQAPFWGDFDDSNGLDGRSMEEDGAALPWQED